MRIADSGSRNVSSLRLGWRLIIRSRSARDAMEVAHHFCGGSWNKRRAPRPGKVEVLPANVLFNALYRFLRGNGCQVLANVSGELRGISIVLSGTDPPFYFDPAFRTGLLSFTMYIGPRHKSLIDKADFG